MQCHNESWGGDRPTHSQLTSNVVEMRDKEREMSKRVGRMRRPTDREQGNQQGKEKGGLSRKGRRKKRAHKCTLMHHAFSSSHLTPILCVSISFSITFLPWVFSFTLSPPTSLPYFIDCPCILSCEVIESWEKMCPHLFALPALSWCHQLQIDTFSSQTWWR